MVSWRAIPVNRIPIYRTMPSSFAEGPCLLVLDDTNVRDILVYIKVSLLSLIIKDDLGRERTFLQNLMPKSKKNLPNSRFLQ